MGTETDAVCQASLFVFSWYSTLDFLNFPGTSCNPVNCYWMARYAPALVTGCYTKPSTSSSKKRAGTSPILC